MTRIYLITNCYNDPNKIYIGKTINNRKAQHKLKFGSNITYDYIDDIDSINKKDWKPLECFWIEYFRFLGLDIQNKNNGGNGVEYHKDITKLKIKLSKSKNPHPNLRKDVQNYKNDIIREYLNGEGPHTLSKIFKCHPDVIKRILKEGNIIKRNPSQSQKSRKDLKLPKRTDLWDNINRIKELYNSGINYTKLGKLFNTSDVQIRIMINKK